ncbi:MAG: sugar phosphate isomerase/epimerase [Oscillospiraceae bacterium]|nr:sugar phosphate isomerase/epimerase [Oscillospiraceae bacterium]MDD4413840.1 sugar phosphate isomerase/epimerase [Oscillospiraceae bacterium]
MNIGASTSNLYPMNTEDALDELLKAGFRTVEVFLNTESEATPEFASNLRKRADEYRAHIVSVHSYNSISESFLFFSNYQRRLKDGLIKIEEVYKAAFIMGASYVILHGDKPSAPLSDNDSAKRYEMLYDLGKENGITVLLENVVNHRSGNLSYITNMRRLIGDKAKFVFDLKQCIRCSLKPSDVITAMSGGIRHVHISDCNRQHECLIPGKGIVDYKQLITCLKENGFDGDIILELYRNNFSDVSDLVMGCHALKDAIK